MPSSLRPALLLATLLLTPVLGFALPRWTGLPALDAHQWQGPYAGQTVCPMCRHGYDAGVLILLPGDASPDAVGTAMDSLHSAMQGSDDPRFRIFLVLLDPPAAALHERLARLPPDWHVGTLLKHERPVALAAFGSGLPTRGSAHVFAQRRSLREFDPTAAVDATDLAADLRWAGQVLAHAYAEPVASTDPDTPKGLLWTAPAQLGASATLEQGASPRQLCLQVEPPETVRDALIGLRLATPRSRAHWARTDATGCVEIRLAQSAFEVELFGWRMPPVHWRVEAPNPSTQRITTRSDPLRSTGISGREPVVGGRCDGCEAAFIGLPGRLPAIARLVGEDATGERLRIRGRVLGPDGRPQAGVVVYAYQTDAAGHYPPAVELPGAAARHGRLRGWSISDEDGRYGFDTVRPASYPDSSVEQHVHMHVIEPLRCTYYVGDLLFDDDPKLGTHQRERAALAHGGSGLVRPTVDSAGWLAHRDIRLGFNVPGYEGCSAGPTPTPPAPAPSAPPRSASR